MKALDRANGDLGRAIARLVDAHGTLKAFSLRLGFSRAAIGRWVTGDKVPGDEAAAALCKLSPEMRPLLVAKGAFRRFRGARPVASGAQTTERAEARIAAARRVADEHAAELARPSEATKAARRSTIAELAETRKKARAQKRRKADEYAKCAAPWHTHRVSRSGDLIERVSEIAPGDVAVATTLATEGL